MVMDPRFNRLLDSSATEFQLENEIILSTLKESQDIPGNHKDATSMTPAPTLDSRNDHDSGPTIEYISQVLLDDSNIDENNNPCLIYDPNSLRAVEFQLENEIILSTLKESQDIPDSHKDATSMTHAPTLDSQNDHDSGLALKYISQMLMDDSNIDENNYPCLFYDPNSLRAVENVFYDALHQNPSVPYQVPLFVNNKSGSLDSTFGCSGDYSTGLFSSSYRLNSIVNTKMDTSETVMLGPNVFNDTESILQFRRGVEEASGYFPSGNQLLFNIEKGHSSDSSRGKKHQHRGDVGLEEERSSKQSAVYGEDEVLELVELFDKIFLFSNNMDPPSVVEKSTQQKGRGRGKGYSKKQGGACENVDIESLLTSCAQSIAEADHRIAEEKLKKIRQYSSPTGDANQRLSHAFANALQARMDGTGAQQYAALASNKITASGMIKTGPFLSKISHKDLEDLLNFE
ncbi:unnamed protein product [Cuscuta epithymum]|uniref:Uncharacterized protein n=1 Tax=Cuscuta epithymum TaxID=186058 RepID=A0AAV0CGZ5_9ASTE|nr:unnamed protein product [Cuscuta epithymum]